MKAGELLGMCSSVSDLETKKLQRRWKRDGCSVCVRLFQTFSLCFVFASVSCVFFPLSSSLSLYWFVHFLLPYSADFICRKMEQRPKVSPYFFLISFLFHLFFSSISSTACLPSWSHNNARMKEETPSVLCVFSLLTSYLSCVFLSFFFYFSPIFLPFSPLFFPSVEEAYIA